MLYLPALARTMLQQFRRNLNGTFSMRVHKPFPAWLMAIALALISSCSSNPSTETPGQYVNDAVITSKVKAAILKEPSLKVTQIGVETYQGEVQLSGFVSSRLEISKAGDVARRIPGVKTVRNDLHLRSN